MLIYLTQEDVDNINRGRNEAEKLTLNSIESILYKPNIASLNKLFPERIGFTPGSDWTTYRKLLPWTREVADRAAASAEEEGKKALIAVEVNPKDPADPLNVRELLEEFNAQRKRLPLLDQKAGANLECKIGYYLNRVPYHPQEALIYLKRSLEGHEAIASKPPADPNQPGEALVYYKRLLAEHKAVVSEPQIKLTPDLDYIRALCTFGNVWVDYGDNAKGIEFYKRAQKALEDLISQVPKEQKDRNGDPIDPEIRYCQIMLERHLGSAHNGMHKREQALKHYGVAEQLIERYYNDLDDFYKIQRVMSLAYHGGIDEAIALFESLVKKSPTLVLACPENFLDHILYNNKAKKILNESESEEKIKDALKCCEKAKHILLQDPNNRETPYAFFITDTMYQIYFTLTKHSENKNNRQAYIDEAMKLAEESLAITEAMYRTKETGHADLAKALRRLGEIYDQLLEDQEMAKFYYKKALPIAIQNLNPEHGDRLEIEAWLRSHGINLKELIEDWLGSQGSEPKEVEDWLQSYCKHWLEVAPVRQEEQEKIRFVC